VAALRKKLVDAGVRILPREPGWGADVKRLWQEADVAAHGDCPGLCAAIRSDSLYTTAVAVQYYCDRTDLHRTADEATALASTAAAAAAEEAERTEMTGWATGGARARRAFLATIVAEDVDDALALRVLRDHVTDLVADASSGWIADVLDFPPNDDVIRAQRVAELDINQLAVVLDLVNNDYPESMLERPACWEPGRGYGGTRDWRDRLATLYGYEWSEPELKLIEAHEVADDDLGDDAPDEADDSDEPQFIDVPLPEFDEATAVS
jgi:hypothetical protein